MSRSLSMNEVEGLAYKAARGAGFAWGLAEEVAMGARLLAAEGFPWAAVLAGLLDRQAAGAEAESCPIVQGCRLLDGVSADRLLARPGETALLVQVPIWVVALIARLVEREGVAIEIAWPRARVRLPSLQVLEEGGLAAVDTMPVTFHPGRIDLPGPSPRSRATRAHAAPELLSRLTAYEARIFVPASERSRLSGAGAGLSDND